jgi:hypothetical protein
MDIRVKNGTPLHRESLCETCSQGHIARGYCASEVLVICRATSPEHRVRYRIRACSSYIESNRESLYDMKQIAWVLAPREGKRKAGFIPAAKLEKEPEIELFLSDPD